MHYCIIQTSIALQCYCGDMHQHEDDLRVDLSLYKLPGVTSGVATERLLLADKTPVSDFYLKSIPHFAEMFVNC